VQILDLARTNDAMVRVSSTVAVVLPREALRNAIRTDNLHGLVLRGDAGTGGLLADYMRALATRAGVITLDEAGSTPVRADGRRGAYVQTRRLARAHADLADPSKAPRKIYEVAYRWGFVSEAHFSRAFRRAFGVTPGDVGAGVGGVLTAAESSVTDLGSERAYRGWLRSLRHA
jgi:AraC-like DNA-binding protein